MDREPATSGAGRCTYAVAASELAGRPRSAHTYDYILTAEVRGISAASNAAQSDYFLVAFKLVDYDDLLVWESQYEVKKEGRYHRIYR